MPAWAASVGSTPLTSPTTVEDEARHSLDMGIGALATVDNTDLVPPTLGEVTDTWATIPREPEGHFDLGPLRAVEPNTANKATGVMSLTSLHCHVCNLRVDNRSQLVGHIRAMRDLHHRGALVGTSPNY